MGNREKEHIPALILHSPATHSFFLRQRLLWQQQHHLYGLGIILCESYLTCFLLIHLRIPDQGLRRWDPSILTGTRLKMSIHTALQYKHLLSNRELHCSWLHNSCQCYISQTETWTQATSSYFHDGLVDCLPASNHKPVASYFRERRAIKQLDWVSVGDIDRNKPGYIRAGLKC